MRGHRVSGSDMRDSDMVRSLRDEGIRVTVGHDPANLADADLVLASSAIPPSNPEVEAAEAAGIPVLNRREFLAPLMADKRVIAISGTHGKTTTTSMIALILHAAGREPSFIVGGRINTLGTNAQAGAGAHFVIEADEYDRMFLGLRPWISVVTNVEMDHPDCYPDLTSLRAAFAAFVNKVPADGLIIACTDGPQTRMMLREAAPKARVLTYGLTESAAYVVNDICASPRDGTTFAVSHKGELWMRASCAAPGVHNALNATAALLVAQSCHVDMTVASRSLADYGGVARRFELKGVASGIRVLDDYAHHPTEIAATLSAARQAFPKARIWAIMQPHTYGRVTALFEEFAHCADDADHLIVTEVYGARPHREAEGAGQQIDGAKLAASIHHRSVAFIENHADIVRHLVANAAPGDIIITLGAGDSEQIGEHLLTALEETTQS